MKILKIAGVGSLVVLVLLVASFRLFGLNPKDQRPGLWLSGTVQEAPVSDWSFTDEHEEIFVQTNTRIGIPHSVTTYSTDYQGDFYLFSAYYGGGNFPDDRAWNRNVMRDPRVRIKIGDNLYDRQLNYVADESIRQAVHRELEAKYPEWNSPGLENVYVFRVDARS